MTQRGLEPGGWDRESQQTLLCAVQKAAWLTHQYILDADTGQQVKGQYSENELCRPSLTQTQSCCRRLL